MGINDMRYVCDDCGSIFYEPNETIPLGTNEIHDCCPMCKSVNISKDKSFEDSCKDLEAFKKNCEGIRENFLRLERKADEMINSDYVIRFNDLIADIEEQINILKGMKEEMERY